MGIVQLFVDLLLGPITLFEVVTNAGVLLREIGATVDVLAAGRFGLFFEALVTGDLLLSKAVAGVVGTLLWLSVLGAATR